MSQTQETLPYIHVNGSHIVMPQTDPFEIMISNSASKRTEKPVVETTKENALAVSWFKDGRISKKRTAMLPRYKREIIDNVNDFLKTKENQGCDISVKSNCGILEKDPSENGPIFLQTSGRPVAFPETTYAKLKIRHKDSPDVERYLEIIKDGESYKTIRQYLPAPFDLGSPTQSLRAIILELNIELQAYIQDGSTVTAVEVRTDKAPDEVNHKTRRDKTNYYLDIAETVASRSTCLRRQYGAIIVKDDQIIATGYNGAPRGIANCSDLGYCTRAKNNIPHGERYEQCRAIHAEMNAIISASRTDTIGQTLYLVGLENGQYVENATPCLMCTRVIVNAGIKNIIIRKTKNDYVVLTNEDLIKMLS